MEESNIRRMSCYAVLRAGYTGDNYLSAHMRLVLALIAKKRYYHVDVKTLVNDFPSEFGYIIDYFPMRQILNLAISQGYLLKKSNRNQFYPTEKIKEYSSKEYSLIETEIDTSEIRIYAIIKAFQAYSHDLGVDYSDSDANDILFAYVNTQKLNHISGKIDSIIHDKRVDHIFGKFVFHLQKNSKELFNYLTTIVTGSILADFLTYEENIGTNKTLDHTTFIFDTSVVFMTLGLDVVERQEYYTSLIRSLKNKGAIVSIFRHSYDEMQQIILGAADWMENYQYDPLYASDVAVFFHDKGASRDDVLEYSTNLKAKLVELGFDTNFIDIDCNESNRIYQINEDELHQRIVERYKMMRPDFDAEKKSNSIWLDVKSISLVYLLRGNANPTSINDSKYLFVTANRALNKTVFDYHSEIKKNSRTIPASVTDVFLGTFLWLGDPIQITKMNEQRMISNAYLAFQPTSELISKLSKTVGTLLSSGEIDTSTYYTLKSNRYVLDKLAEKTLGDPDAYEENTPMDILKEIREEGRREGILESDRKHAEQIAIQRAEEEQKRRAEEEKGKKLLVELLQFCEESKKSKQHRREEINILLKKANRIRNFLKIMVAFIYIVLIGVMVYGIYRLARIGQKDSFDYLGVALAIIPLLFQAILSLISWFTSKEIKPWTIANKIIDWFYTKWCQRKDCSQEEENTLDTEIDQLNKRIDELKQQLSNQAEC